MNATPTAFEGIVAAFGDPIRCERKTLPGEGCRRPAYWLVDLHGCERMFMCGQHRTAWLRRHRALDLRRGELRCAHCRHAFACIDDAVRVTAI
ncbi:hypothetical protein MSIMFI_03785 [Mycobacterium simulans]|uniref:hypothetical protein n=1 Tax=Mycobacterium simulans TaxID=627089 RepID=UPI001748197C|nr:hypothetical protein [Mycobacterium simulans]SON62260.1 hypothetical protein MSIMFI_03785 [Mycobacterium simulans]